MSMVAPGHSHKSPKIAVIVPVYNSALYLAECLDSLLAQTYENFCIFAVNDGSSDSSAEILESYKKKDSRINLVHKTNGGAASARNAGLDLIASGKKAFDFICFVDSDDVVSPDFLSDYVKAGTTKKLDYIVCGWNSFDRRGIAKPKQHHDPSDLDPICAFDQFYAMGKWGDPNLSTFSNFLGNRCFASRIALTIRFNEKLNVAEDQDFITRALFLVQNGHIFSKVNYFYRQRNSSLMHSGPFFDAESYYENLIELYESAPEYAKAGILSHAVYYWWKSVKVRIKNGSFNQHKKKFDQDFSLFKSSSYYDSLNLKLKRHLRYYSLGFYFLEFYFSLKKADELPNNKDCYFK